jgi:hypothetical protein
MYFDTHGAIVMEQNAPDDPGRFGDSCAETGRYFHLHDGVHPVLRIFVTPTGYVRHPEAPWREDDFSGDQAVPFYLAADPLLREEFEERVKAAGWKTGNGDYLALIWISIFYQAKGKQSWLTDLPILAQAFWLRFFSWTYDDGVADHLNFFHVLLQAKRSGHTITSRIASWLMPHARFMRAIETYYKPEPNSQWVIDAYRNTSL